MSDSCPNRKPRTPTPTYSRTTRSRPPLRPLPLRACKPTCRTKLNGSGERPPRRIRFALVAVSVDALPATPRPAAHRHSPAPRFIGPSLGSRANSAHSAANSGSALAAPMARPGPRRPSSPCVVVAYMPDAPVRQSGLKNVTLAPITFARATVIHDSSLASGTTFATAALKRLTAEATLTTTWADRGGTGTIGGGAAMLRLGIAPRVARSAAALSTDR